MDLFLHIFTVRPNWKGKNGHTFSNNNKTYYKLHANFVGKSIPFRYRHTYLKNIHTSPPNSSFRTAPAGMPIPNPLDTLGIQLFVELKTFAECLVFFRRAKMRILKKLLIQGRWVHLARRSIRLGAQIGCPSITSKHQVILVTMQPT